MKSISPAPWAVIEDGENTPYVQRRIKSVSDAEASPVAWDVRNLADAHLIAAAPEMLEALQEIWEMIGRGELVRDISQDSSSDFALKMLEFVPRLNKIMLAIAKATGGDE